MDQGMIAIVIIAVMMLFFILQKFPIAITAMLAAISMAAFDLIEIRTILYQFGTNSIFSVLGMMIIGGTLFETGLAQKLGNILLKQHKPKLFAAILLIVTTLFSSFTSNAMTTAMFMPVVAGIAARSNGEITKKNTFMLIGIGATLGGCMMLTGSPSQHSIIQNLLIQNGCETMGFFYGVKGTLCILAVVILYFWLIGCKIEEKVFDFPEVPNDSGFVSKELTGGNIRKMVMSGCIMIITVLLVIFNIASTGESTFIGAMACILTGCIDFETAIKKIDLKVIMLLGALFAVSEGFNNSGAGEICTNAIFAVFGNHVSPFLLYAVVILVSVILTNLIDNLAAEMLIAPIALQIALSTGINPAMMLFSVLMGCNIAFATPIAAPCITMTLAAGYRFTDYVKVGGPLAIAAYFAVIALFPVLYGF